MAEDSQADRLAATHHIVLVLRLVAEANGNVLYGEVMNAAGAPGDRGCRFVGLAELGGAVRTCVSAVVRDPEAPVRCNETPLKPSGTEHGPVK